MTEVAYKPPVEYTEKLNTPATKFPLLSSLCLMGLKIIGTNSVSRSSIGSTTATLYTVPVGKTFYLTTATLDSSIASTAPGVLMSIIQSTTGGVLAFVYRRPGSSENKNASRVISYPIPVAFQVGEEIKVSIVIDTDSSGLTDVALATIVGYEMDNTIIPNLI